MEPQYYTDYPFVDLGDLAGKEAPIRSIKVLRYDGNKYCDVIVDCDLASGYQHSIKLGYIYTAPGRLGEVPSVDHHTARRLWGAT